MATQWHFNPFTGTLDKVIDPTEAIAHSDLSDMPDSGGTNTDHDLRYWTLGTNQTLLTGDKSGSFDLTTTGDVEADALITTGGASSDFVKGDGSLDSSTYLTTVAFGDLSDYPANAAGALTNDGAGNLSWVATGGSQDLDDVLSEGDTSASNNLTLTAGTLTASAIESTVAAGTPPLVVASDDVVVNLNANYVEGKDTDELLDSANHAVDASGFVGNLGVGDTDVQTALETIDGLTIAATPHDLLDGTIAQDTVEKSAVEGSIILANSTPAWDTLAIGADGKFLKSDGTTAGWDGIDAADLPSGIDAAKIGGGDVSTTEYDYLNGVTSAIQDQLNNKTDLDGNEAVTGAWTFNTALPTSIVTPSNAADLTTKTYVDSIVNTAGSARPACNAATTAALPACTYDNGTAGVGATLTGDADGALAAQDGVTLTVNQRLLVKNQAATANNGAYALTTVGDAENPFVLTRVTDYDAASADEIVNGSFFPITSGTTNANTLWMLTTAGTITVGTTGLSYTLLKTSDAYIAGDGLDLTGTTFSLDVKANDGLAIKSTEISVDYDDSTIGIVSNKLAVKDLGITNAKIANSTIDLTTKVTGALPNANLAAVTTANKIKGSSLYDVDSTPTAKQFPTGALGTGSPDSTKFLRGDGVWAAASTVVTGNEVVTNVDVIADVGTAAVGVYYKNLPSAVGEMALSVTVNGTAYDGYRWKYDCSNVTQFRIIVAQTVAGSAFSKLRLRYSTDNSTYLDAESGTTGYLDVGVGTGVKVGEWTDLVAGGKDDVWFALFGSGGNGTADPGFKSIYVQYRVVVTGGGAGGDTVKVSADDTTAGYLSDKIIAGDGIAIDEAAGGNETMTFSVDGSDLAPSDLTGGNYILPSADGSDGQILTTDGAGAVAWEGLDLSGYAPSDLLGGSYTLPSSDGSDGQVLTTDGAGTVAWEDAAGGSPAGDDGNIQINSSGSFGALTPQVVTESDVSISNSSSVSSFDCDSTTLNEVADYVAQVDTKLDEVIAALQTLGILSAS